MATRTEEPPKLGAKVRALRRREKLTQVQLAERLGISPSYLNLIESNRRPLPAALLIALAKQFAVDIQDFASDNDARLTSDLMEVFSDPSFDAYSLTGVDLRDLATNHPSVGRAILSLYQAYQATRDANESLAQRISQGEELGPVERSRIPSEEVNDLVQKYLNYFPELEDAAEQLWKKAHLDREELYPGLIRYLEKSLGITVRIARRGDEPGLVRRYDETAKRLTLSELLPTRSRTFQLAHQIAHITQRAALDRIAQDPLLTGDESRGLARLALANYFAGAVLMPYTPFLEAARAERYDIEVIGRRYRVGFEQVCHRLTTLRRPGAEGIPFHMIRIDVAGNISKRFSASGIRFARFSGACPKWNVFAAFMTPGMLRIQLSTMPDNESYFCIARTIHKDSGGYHSQQPVSAIGLGCKIEYAKALVYADGVDVDHLAMAVPVGVTCRVCDRTDCEQRAFPSLKHPLQVDANVRGVSIYTPVRIT